MSYATHFTHAIVREPANNAKNGLRAIDVGAPDIAKLQRDHLAYREAISAAGAEVIILPALEEFPDCCFVEDTALCLPQGAILMRPGAASRLGEANAILPTLKEYYEHVQMIEPPGHIEGGDILMTDHEILVGTSSRTNDHGIAQLSEIVSNWGYTVRKVNTPKGVLHFKTDCSLLAGSVILSTPRLEASGCFADYEVINTATGEEACANTIRFNDMLIMPAGFPVTKQKLEGRGFEVIEINNIEAAKLDGGMSCLSLRFSPAR